MDYMEGVVSKLGELSEDISSRVDLKPLLLLLLSISQDICIQLTSNFSSSIAASDTLPTNTERLPTNLSFFFLQFLFLFTLMSVFFWSSDENCWFGQCSVSAGSHRTWDTGQWNGKKDKNSEFASKEPFSSLLRRLWTPVRCRECPNRSLTLSLVRTCRVRNHIGDPLFRRV